MSIFYRLTTSLKASLLSAACLGALQHTAIAAPFSSSTSTQMNVSATFVNSCAVSVAPLAFGSTLSVAALPIKSTTTLTLTCTYSLPFEIGMNEGNGGVTASVTTRKMTAGGATLDYTIYKDAGYSSIWGNTPSPATPSNTLAGVGTGNAQTITVYGEILNTANNRTVGALNFNDVIQVTVYF